MSHDVCVTRGGTFDDAGAEPITLEQWRTLVDGGGVLAWAEPAAHGADSASTTSGAILRWEDGRITASSPRELTQLLSICSALGARLFGEDGSELGLELREEVLKTVARGFPSVDTSSLTVAACQDLASVSDPGVPEGLRRRALATIAELGGAQGRAALAYLVCRAVECGGAPEPETTEAAAMLLHLDPSLVGGLRVPPTAEWVNALERRARRPRSTEEPRIVRCACGAQNRIPASIPPGKRPRCGHCKSPLPP